MSGPVPAGVGRDRKGAGRDRDRSVTRGVGVGRVGPEEVWGDG